MSAHISFRLSTSLSVAVATALICAPAVAQHAPSASVSAAREQATGRALEAARRQGAPELYAFLKGFPKGADLHIHLSGAIYAETFVREAATQGLCLAAAPPPCEAAAKSCPAPVLDAKHIASPLGFAKPDAAGACAAGQMKVADAMNVQPVYDAMLDSFSMRSFVPSAGWSGHDQFFATFDRFGGLKDVQGEWLDEVATRAAAQNEQYLEIMQTPPFSHALAAGYKLGWPADFSDSNYKQKLAALRDQLISGGLRDDVATDTADFAAAKIKRAQLEHCIPEKDAWMEQTPCNVQIHFLYQVLRGFPPQQVFAQTLLGFELASADPDVVGINFVRAEDWRGPMAEYHTEMLMMDYLHSVYPKVRISLHAGELAPGMVPPDGLSFHIREAVELGHAERVGHGIDVLHEDNAADLLKEMAAKHILVEINLTSNDVILGIKGSDHPLAAYRAAHVPFALSTDDEGVSRIDLTHEYARAVLEQGLTYADLKTSARASLEHSFLPGVSLWSAPDVYTRRNPACAAVITASSPSAACAAFLQTSERAMQQYELERRLAAFEAVSR